MYVARQFVDKDISCTHKMPGTKHFDRNVDFENWCLFQNDHIFSAASFGKK